jgi:predicted membrane-bound spermidine synthase
MRGVLAAIFFVSGCAALLFESLWFRQAHLAFGSSVWASSLVLSGFMAGVALGSAGAARLGGRVRSPLRAYALLEIAVGILGLALVVALPHIGRWMVPLFRTVLETEAILQPLRFASCFVLLLGPAAAIGATLPLLVRAVARDRRDFGHALGALYGWNTLGAVCGALAGEACLISRIGVMGTGAVAAGLDVLAALAAVVVVRSRQVGRLAPAPHQASEPVGSADLPRATGRVGGLLAASFLAGGLLLALEVVWFRLLLLFMLATSLAFSVLLAVVLAGIGLGSLAASAWLRRDPLADRWLATVAYASGVAGILGYHLLEAPLAGFRGQLSILSPTCLALAVVLMLPASAASGMLFALLGKALNDALGVPVRSVGLLVLVNTLGAAAGPLVACFALLPWLGVERSIFGLCASYAGVALLAVGIRTGRGARLSALASIAFFTAVLSFPFGRMDARYLPAATAPLLWPGATVVAVREGRSETVQYTRSSFLGEPAAHQLLTNGLSMAGSGIVALRYMSLFVHLPVALHPAPRDALLISYGVGNTARSLTRVEGLRSIDVVEISQEILDMSGIAFPDPAEDPVLDPRVRLHVEDGRYFLQATRRQFDLITGEPPPPRVGNVTYLYTEEYFRLAHDRLRPGGLISYWLPVDQLTPAEAGSITHAFCAVFSDCSVWNGASLNWILIGSRGGIAPLDPDTLARQWRDPPAAADLRAIGVESPEALGALFIADAGQIRELTDLGAPLQDDFPMRIRNMPQALVPAWFLDFQDSDRCRQRFVDSAWVRERWPEALRRETLRQFRLTGLFDRAVGVAMSRSQRERLDLLRVALETSELETLPLLALGGTPRQVEIARRRRDQVASAWDGDQNARASARVAAETQLAMAALARRDWSGAAARYRGVASRAGWSRHLAIYASCRAGEHDAVDALRREVFAGGSESTRPAGPAPDAGIDGCWAAAWDPGWRAGHARTSETSQRGSPRT